MEKGDAKGQPDAHYPELDAVREYRHVDVSRLGGAPVAVEQEDGGEGYGESSDAEHGHIATAPEEDHASGQEERPHYGVDDPEDA